PNPAVQPSRVPGRKSLAGTPSGLLFSPRRTSLAASHIQPHVNSVHYDVQTFGSSLPVKVMEALTMAEADDIISVKVDESGWAWMVCGKLLIIWKICQTVVAKLCVCKELQLAPSEYEYTADLVTISSPGPLETAPVQSISVLTVGAEGRARYWASLAHEGNHTEADLELGDLCNFVVAVRGGSFVVSSCRNHLLRVSTDPSGRLGFRALQQGQGVLSGIGRRVSSLFGMLAPPPNDELHSVLWASEAGCLYSLTSSKVCRWEVGDSSEQQTLSWESRCSLDENIADAIWGSESNYEEMKEGVNVSYLDMKLSPSGLVVLAAAWHSQDIPCIAYFCLVTLQDVGASVSDHVVVEVTKHTTPFQMSMETPNRTEAVAHEDKTKMLKDAFLRFCRSDLIGSQVLVDELFPAEGAGEGEEGAELDEVVTRIDLDLVDDYPASDPRWAESVPEESGGFPLTSLIILHQLEDKMKAHTCFMDFLLQVGLLQRLGQVTLRGGPMATRLLLCEHAEKLQAAMVLKTQHGKHGELVNAAVSGALRKNGAAVPPSLTPADVFFREVSQISLVFECLLEEEERRLKENPVASVQWAETVLTVNNILKDMLQAAGQYRDTKASMYRSPPPPPTHISVITRQHEVVLRSVYPQADSELRGALCEQLVGLLDLYLGGYVAQLASLQLRTGGRPAAAQQERYNALELEYGQRRSELIAPLLDLGQYQWVAALSEKFCDFDMLVQMCEQTDNQSRLQHYMTKFSDQNFADFVFRWYMEKGKRGKLLSQPSAHHPQLASFLQSHQHLSWLHHIHVHDYQSAHETLSSQATGETRYFSKKKTLLALSKLTALASDMDQTQLSRHLEDIVEQERFLLHQETLPEQLLEDKNLDRQTMPLLTPHGLITLYISEDNRISNEDDFKKALDLLEYINEEVAVDIETLKREIFARALKKDDWCSWEGSDDPLEPARDSVFVKILLKLIQEGVSLQAYLPDVKELLDSEQLAAFNSKPYFEYVLRVNYEHYLQSQI
uniref:Nucleoporin 133 n=1 Tax=Gadus morhua TaxID=8049 RepID=A0A8C5BNS0_GADMO